MTKQSLSYFKEHPGYAMSVVAVMLVLVGTCDYLAGANCSLLILYLMPIGFATWVVGRRFGFLTALLSLVLWTISNEMATGQSHNPFVSGWNIFSASAVFGLLIVLLSKLELFLQSLEARVEERTRALRRLEKEILEVSEQEQRRIGHDLHDTVCQILAGTTIAMKILEGKLSAKGLSEATDAKEIKMLIQKAIEMTRDVARGLSPIALTAEGLMDALHQLAERVTYRNDMFCVLDYNDPLFIKDVNTATQIYLIVQEAVMNAVRHSKANRIVIGIRYEENKVFIQVEDNGIGLPKAEPTGSMGRRIMHYRAMMIGGELAVENVSPHGTMVSCILPNPLPAIAIQSLGSSSEKVHL